MFLVTREQRGDLLLLRFDVIAYGAVQTGVLDPVRAVGERGQKAALELVLALRAGFELPQLALDRELQTLVVESSKWSARYSARQPQLRPNSVSRPKYASAPATGRPLRSCASVRRTCSLSFSNTTLKNAAVR